DATVPTDPPVSQPPQATIPLPYARAPPLPLFFSPLSSPPLLFPSFFSFPFPPLFSSPFPFPFPPPSPSFPFPSFPFPFSPPPS
ncbi:hypothetical protein ACXWR7_11730, partial [Streptococcus pyogenes]